MERRNFLKLLGVAATAALHSACAQTVSATETDASPGDDASPASDAPAEEAPPTQGASPAAAYVIHGGFTVLLNDSSCSGHSHTVDVLAGSFASDTPVHYLGGSHEVAFLPSELVQLERGERVPFSTIGPGPGHGHCGTAWRTSVGPEEHNRPDACVLRSATAVCVQRH